MPTKRSLLSGFILTLSLISFGFMSFKIWERYQPPLLMFATAGDSGNVAPVPAAPSRIIISGIGVDLPVFSNNIVNNRWPAPSNGISYLATSPLPGSAGNSIYYGHNWPRLLGRLDELSEGQSITLITEEGIAIAYTVTSKFITHAGDTSILKDTDNSQITLYTCTGFLDSKRLVVVALLSS